MGIVAFSIIGVLFLLLSLAMLGEYFISGFANGMLLYMLSAAVGLFSALLIRRFNGRMSILLEILAIGGIHVATYRNTYVLKNISVLWGILIVVLTTLLVLGIDKLIRKSRWRLDGVSAGAYTLFVCTIYMMLALHKTDIWIFGITMSVLLLVTKLLARQWHMYPVDAALTAVVSIHALGGCGQSHGYLLLAVLLLSALLIRYWHMYYQCVITTVCMLFLLLSLEHEIAIMLMVAGLWVFMLLFNRVEKIRGSSIAGYNYVVAIMELLCYLSLAFISYQEYGILYFILAFLGVGFLYFMFQEKYFLPSDKKGIAVAVMMSYITLCADFTFAVTGSVLLLGIGVLCIGGGFAASDKVLRIYGLAVSLLVCFRIAFFDFSGGNELQRMLMFFVAGIVALIISGIYLILGARCQGGVFHKADVE